MSNETAELNALIQRALDAKPAFRLLHDAVHRAEEMFARELAASRGPVFAAQATARLPAANKKAEEAKAAYNKALAELTGRPASTAKPAHGPQKPGYVGSASGIAPSDSYTALVQPHPDSTLSR